MRFVPVLLFPALHGLLFGAELTVQTLCGPLAVVLRNHGLQADALPLPAQGIQQFVELFLGQGVHQHQFIGKRFSFRLCRIRRLTAQKRFQRLALPFRRDLPAAQAQPK